MAQHTITPIKEPWQSRVDAFATHYFFKAYFSCFSRKSWEWPGDQAVKVWKLWTFLLWVSSGWVIKPFLSTGITVEENAATVQRILDEYNRMNPEPVH